MDRGIYDNMVSYQTPEFGGFTAFAQYSFGTSGDDMVPSRDKERYAVCKTAYRFLSFLNIQVYVSVSEPQFFLILRTTITEITATMVKNAYIAP